MILEIKSVAKYVRMSPLKINLVLNLIRGKSVKDACSILEYTNKRASKIVEKVLKSAIANAENNSGIDKNNLIVKTTYVNNGPILKRFRPRDRGKAFRINKRTSHITVIVSEVMI